MPASSHASPTSGILETAFLHFLHFIFISSIHGLFISLRLSTLFLSIALSLSSFRLPATKVSPQPHSQIGKGNPQYLSLEISQSPIFLNHSSCRTFPYSGYHLTFLFSSINFFFIFLQLTYHSETNLKTSSSPQRQQWGYLCL